MSHNNCKKMFKTTSVVWGRKYDKFIVRETEEVPKTSLYKTGVKVTYRLNPEMEAKLRASSNKKLIEYYDEFFPHEQVVMARVFGVVVASLVVKGYPEWYQG